MAGGLKWDVYEVFIASPNGPSTVQDSRDAVEAAIQNWNQAFGIRDHAWLVGRRWEEAVPQLQVSAQTAIDWTQVDPADILVAFFGTSLGRGTVHEIERFLINGKARSSMVYFPAQLQSSDMRKLRSHYEDIGLVHRYRDPTHLVEQVTQHLGEKVADLREAGNSWPKLKRATAAIHRWAPYPLARFLVDEVLKDPAHSMDQVMKEAEGFKRRGLDDYRDYVHGVLREEARARTRTKILAVCGEKGLRKNVDARGYFKPFYDFANGRPNCVYRAFVQRASGQKHLTLTSEVIEAHRAANGVIALEVEAQRREELRWSCPGICDELDRGFGVVAFARPCGNHLIVVHCGTDKELTFAVFSAVPAMRQLFRLINRLYRESREYRQDGTLRGEIDHLFTWLDGTLEGRNEIRSVASGSWTGSIESAINAAGGRMRGS